MKQTCDLNMININKFHTPYFEIDCTLEAKPPSNKMAAIHRLLPISSAETLLLIPRALKLNPYAVIFFHKNGDFPAKSAGSILQRLSHGGPGRRRAPSRVSAGWFSGLGVKKEALPEIVKAGDPVLHEPAGEVPLEDIGSEKIQKIVDDMIGVMRKAPGVGLAAPQIGIPLRIIVLEDTKEYISYAPKDETEAQDRHPFDLLVIINPKVEKKGNQRALFFEGCLSIDGFRAMVERHLQVEVTGYSRFGQPMKIDSSGWMARILQHEYDHLDGTLYVDKIVPRTFRTVENLDLPLPVGCPKAGVCNQVAPPSKKLEPGKIYILLPGTELRRIMFVKFMEFTAVEEVQDEGGLNLLLDSY